MTTARHPARQLNSKAIRDVILSYMVPAVQDKFYIVHAKATWRVEKDADSLTKAWKLVCEKREECDDVLNGLGNLAFYFSSISSYEPPKSKEKGKGKEQAPRAPWKMSNQSCYHKANNQAAMDYRVPSMSPWKKAATLRYATGWLLRRQMVLPFLWRQFAEDSLVATSRWMSKLLPTVVTRRLTK